MHVYIYIYMPTYTCRFAFWNHENETIAYYIFFCVLFVSLSYVWDPSMLGVQLYFLHFHCCRLLHPVIVPHLTYLFCGWWTCGCFRWFCWYQQCCSESSHTCIVGYMGHHMSTVYTEEWNCWVKENAYNFSSLQGRAARCENSCSPISSVTSWYWQTV